MPNPETYDAHANRCTFNAFVEHIIQLIDSTPHKELPKLIQHVASNTADFLTIYERRARIIDELAISLNGALMRTAGPIPYTEWIPLMPEDYANVYEAYDRYLKLRRESVVAGNAIAGLIESQLAAIAPGREIRVFEITYLIQQTSLNALCVLLPPFAHSYNNIRDENNIAHFQKLIPADFANNFPASDYTAQQQVTIGDQLLAGLTLLRDRAGMLYDLPTFDMPIETILEFIQADLPNFASDSEKVRSYNKDCLGIGATYRILMYLIENFDINLSALEQSRLRVNFIKRATKRKLQHVANTPEQACPFKH